MRKTLLSLLGIVAIFTASAQFSVGVSANYTMYKGNFQKATPGVQVRASYGFTEKTTAVFAFTYHMPIKQASSVTLMDGYGNLQEAPSEIKYNFKTFNLMGNYTFAGDEASAGKFYGITGAGLVLINYNETIKESYDKNAYTPTNQVSGKESGFTINLGLGGEYNLGSAILFGEAAVALPANQTNGYYVENVVPLHFAFNAGVKINLGEQQ
jgi:hypothetical protein